MTEPTHIASMEPMMPRGSLREIQKLSQQIIYTTGGLNRTLAPESAKAVSILIREMNSYYSNLIEGHRTYPGEIDASLQADLSANPKKAALLQLGQAHVAVEALMRKRLEAEPDLEICSSEFLCWLHRELYARLPQEFRMVKDTTGTKSYPVEPGVFRDHPAHVGHHVPPQAEQLPAFIDRFREAYAIQHIAPTEQLMAVAAAHQRLMWIHPFADGNGRVVRLFTTAYLIRMGLNHSGLWSVSRGLARAQSKYYACLQNADAPRAGDRDGRGALSEAALREFIHFFLEATLDQITFMDDLLDLNHLEQRMENYFRSERPIEGIRSMDEVVRVLLEVLRRGQLKRGRVASLIGKSDRSASMLLKKLQQAGYLTSDSPKTPVRIAFPNDFRDVCFPRLYLP